MEEDQIEPSEKVVTSKKSSKRLFLIAGIIILAIVLICIVLTIIITVVLAATADNSCNGSNCPADLIRVLNYTYDRVSPCDDFYRFSCGRFEGDSGYPTFVASMRHKVMNDLHDIITSPITSDDPPSLAMQKSFYNSCVNVYSDEEERDRIFYNILHALGGWPIVNGSTWQEEAFEWWKAVQTCAEVGLNYDWFMDVDVVEDEDSKVYHLYVGYPGNYMEHIEEEKITAYNRLMEDLAVYMGAPIESVAFEVERTMNFQKDLNKITREAHDKEQLRIGRPPNYRVIDLMNQMPEVNWLEFLERLTNRPFRYDDIVTINSMSYIRELYQLLLRTPKRFQADYIVMKILDKFWPYLNGNIMNYYENFYRSVTMNHEELNRTATCLQEAETRFAGVADAVYIRSAVDPRIKREVKELVSIIKYKLANHLKSATWLDDNAKNDAMVNITEVLEYIGGPDDLFDQEKWEEKLGFTGTGFSYCNTVTVDYDVLFAPNSSDVKQCGCPIDVVTGSISQISRVRFKETDRNIIQKITELNRQLSRKIYAKIEMPVEEDNSDLELILEQIDKFQGDDVTQVLPASFLRYGFYDSSRPKYANYGSLATLISYKITHTFSEKLFEYLRDRKLTQWWSNLLDISHKTKCLPSEDLIDYYKIMTNNGTISIEKHFADNIAFDITFEAYIQWVKQHSTETVPSKFKYNSNEFFWIYSMQQLCSNSADEDYYTQLRDRGNKLVQNSLYFANVFKCPPDSYMNPEEKCQLL